MIRKIYIFNKIQFKKNHLFLLVKYEEPSDKEVDSNWYAKKIHSSCKNVHELIVLSHMDRVMAVINF